MPLAGQGRIVHRMRMVEEAVSSEQADELRAQIEQAMRLAEQCGLTLVVAKLADAADRIPGPKRLI